MNIFVPLIIFGVMFIITILLIIFDYYLGGNEEKTITINNDKKIPVTGNDTVLNSLNKEKIFIPSACGGKATCGFCKFRLIEGGSDILPTEEPFLSTEEKKQGVRLSCQVKVRENLEIEIPKEMMNAKEYKAQITHLKDLTYDTKLVRVKLIKPDTMVFLPGQYAQIKVPGVEVIRAYSIASNPKDKNQIEFIIRYVKKGIATTYIHKAVRVGDEIILTGPYGDFYLNEDSNKEIICIAGGSGKAPIKSILSYLKDRGMPRKVTYFFGALTKKDLYYTDEMQALEKEFSNFRYVPALSKPTKECDWNGETGLITEVLNKQISDMSDMEAYLCGSPRMIDACVKVLKEHNISENSIFYDKFS